MLTDEASLGSMVKELEHRLRMELQRRNQLSGKLAQMSSGSAQQRENLQREIEEINTRLDSLSAQSFDVQTRYREISERLRAAESTDSPTSAKSNSPTMTDRSPSASAGLSVGRSPDSRRIAKSGGTTSRSSVAAGPSSANPQVLRTSISADRLRTDPHFWRDFMDSRDETFGRRPRSRAQGSFSSGGDPGDDETPPDPPQQQRLRRRKFLSMQSLSAMMGGPGLENDELEARAPRPAGSPGRKTIAGTAPTSRATASAASSVSTGFAPTTAASGGSVTPASLAKLFKSFSPSPPRNAAANAPTTTSSGSPQNSRKSFSDAHASSHAPPRMAAPTGSTGPSWFRRNMTLPATRLVPAAETEAAAGESLPPSDPAPEPAPLVASERWTRSRSASADPQPPRSAPDNVSEDEILSADGEDQAPSPPPKHSDLPPSRPTAPAPDRPPRDDDAFSFASSSVVTLQRESGSSTTTRALMGAAARRGVESGLEEGVRSSFDDALSGLEMPAVTAVGSVFRLPEPQPMVRERDSAADVVTQSNVATDSAPKSNSLAVPPLPPNSGDTDHLRRLERLLEERNAQVVTMGLQLQHQQVELDRHKRLLLAATHGRHAAAEAASSSNKDGAAEGTGVPGRGATVSVSSFGPRPSPDDVTPFVPPFYARAMSRLERAESDAGGSVARAPSEFASLPSSTSDREALSAGGVQPVNADIGVGRSPSLPSVTRTMSSVKSWKPESQKGADSEDEEVEEDDEDYEPFKPSGGNGTGGSDASGASVPGEIPPPPSSDIFAPVPRSAALSRKGRGRTGPPAPTVSTVARQVTILATQLDAKERELVNFEEKRKITEELLVSTRLRLGESEKRSALLEKQCGALETEVGRLARDKERLEKEVAAVVAAAATVVGGAGGVAGASAVGGEGHPLGAGSGPVGGVTGSANTWKIRKGGSGKNLGMMFQSLAGAVGAKGAEKAGGVQAPAAGVISVCAMCGHDGAATVLATSPTSGVPPIALADSVVEEIRRSVKATARLDYLEGRVVELDELNQKLTEKLRELEHSLLRANLAAAAALPETSGQIYDPARAPTPPPPPKQENVETQTEDTASAPQPVTSSRSLGAGTGADERGAATESMLMDQVVSLTASLNSSKRQRDDLERRLHDATSRRDAAERECVVVRGDWQLARGEVEKMAAEIVQWTEKTSRLEKELSLVTGAAAAAEKAGMVQTARVVELEGLLAEARGVVASLTARVGALEEEAVGLRERAERLERAEGELHAAKASLDEERERRQEQSRQLEESKQALDVERRGNIVLLSQMESLRRSSADLERRLQEATHLSNERMVKLSDLEYRLASSLSSHEALKTAAGEETSRSAALDLQLAEQRDLSARYRGELETLQQLTSHLQRDAEAKETELRALRGELEAFRRVSAIASSAGEGGPDTGVTMRSIGGDDGDDSSASADYSAATEAGATKLEAYLTRLRTQKASASGELAAVRLRVTQLEALRSEDLRRQEEVNAEANTLAFSLRSRIAELEDALATTQAEAAALRTDASALVGVELVRQQHEQTKGERDRLATELAEARRRLREREEMCEALEEEKRAVMASADVAANVAGEEMAKLRAEVVEAKARVEAEETRMRVEMAIAAKEGEARMADREAELSSLRSELEVLKQRVAELEPKHAAELEVARSQLKSLADDLDAARAESARQASTVSKLQEAAQQAEAAAQHLQATIEAQRQALKETASAAQAERAKLCRELEAAQHQQQHVQTLPSPMSEPDSARLSDLMHRNIELVQRIADLEVELTRARRSSVISMSGGLDAKTTTSSAPRPGQSPVLSLFAEGGASKRRSSLVSDAGPTPPPKTWFSWGGSSDDDD
ncbi:hypothetical protein HDU96_009379 [Phlyctochytrium bullatum]|nr:hypothetical protein HDU96_009379 [Phlyctochytrium bullatum]